MVAQDRPSVLDEQAEAPSASARMTADEFARLPETNLPTELINGEVIMSPSPIDVHQYSVLDIAQGLRKLIPNGRIVIAPMDVTFDDENTVQPDVFWIAEGSRCKRTETGHFRGAPDLIVEVISPGTARRDRKTKFALYEKYGVREYWLYEPLAELLEAWVYHAESKKLARLGAYEPGDVFESPLLGKVEMNALIPQPPASAGATG